MNEQDLAKQAAGAALKAASVAKKGAKLKFGAIAAVVLLVCLILLGMMAPAPNAAGATCANTGPGQGSTVPDPGASSGTKPTGSVSQQQIDNARTIDNEAIKEGLPGRATLIALMTGLQESTLLNIDYGDRDSIGVFQQRPSMDWGTKADIMNVTYAAQSFFQGRGTNKGLVSVPNWTTMQLGPAAQAVQHSGYPDLYAGHEEMARKIASQAGINLERAGTAAGPGTVTGPSSSPGSSAPPITSANPCSAPVTAPTAQPGQQFTDGVTTWTVNNPRTVDQAIAWAQQNTGPGSTGDWRRRCLAWSATVFGWNYSGIDWAIHEWDAIPANMQHPNDRNPPPGALMFWDTGSDPKHIAVYVGGGKVASTDILRPGYADIVDATLLESKWGAKYIGWAPPYFPKAG